MASRRRRLFRIAIGGLALAVAPVVAHRAPASALAQESPAPPETEAARAARKAKALAANDDGVHLAEKGELEPALARLAEALALDPDEPTVRGNAAKVHALVARKRVDERRFVEAAKEYRAAAGLVPGEVVATIGSHVLKSELLKSRLGAGCCD